MKLCCLLTLKIRFLWSLPCIRWKQSYLNSDSLSIEDLFNSLTNNKRPHVNQIKAESVSSSFNLNDISVNPGKDSHAMAA